MSERVTDDFFEKQWRKAGGNFHGPRVETGTMEKAKLIPFLRLIYSVGWGGGAGAETAAHRATEAKPPRRPPMPTDEWDEKARELLGELEHPDTQDMVAAIAAFGQAADTAAERRGIERAAKVLLRPAKDFPGQFECFKCGGHGSFFSEADPCRTCWGNGLLTLGQAVSALAQPAAPDTQETDMTGSKT